MKKTKGYLTIIKIGVVVLFIALYYLCPGLKTFTLTGLSLLKQHDYQGLREFILSYGIWAPLMSILLMVLQSLVPFMPGIAITIINSWIFGWKLGIVYTWLGALCGALVDFLLARWYGRPMAAHFFYGRFYKNIDYFLENHGVFAVFVTRLIPLVPFKVISYGAGFTAMPLVKYTIATAVGQTPAIVLYSFLGHNILRSWPHTLLFTLVLLVIGGLVYYHREKIQCHFIK